MSVNYGKVIDQLTDVIKELNVCFAPCGAAAAAAPSEETRRADAVDLVRALLSTLERAGDAGAAASAEHGASADKWFYKDGVLTETFKGEFNKSVKPPEIKKNGRPTLVAEWTTNQMNRGINGWVYKPK